MIIKDVAEAPYDKNEALFEQLFNKHFRELHAYAFSILRDWDIAEEIVQGQFLKLWERNDWVHIQTSVRSYLYKSIYNDSLNYIRRQKIELKYQTTIAYTMKNYIDDTADKLKMGDLELHLQVALNKLPEKCRAIFHLSRFEELKYKEIAMELNISIKTVETQMSKALRILRKEMKEFLPLLVFTLINILRS